MRRTEWEYRHTWPDGTDEEPPVLRVSAGGDRCGRGRGGDGSNACDGRFIGRELLLSLKQGQRTVMDKLTVNLAGKRRKPLGRGKKYGTNGQQSAGA